MLHAKHFLIKQRGIATLKQFSTVRNYVSIYVKRAIPQARHGYWNREGMSARANEKKSLARIAVPYYGQLVRPGVGIEKIYFVAEIKPGQSFR